MNPLELRQAICLGLTSTMNGPGGLVDAKKLAPVPGEPLVVEITTDDYLLRPGATRRYRVTIEEIDATA